MTPVPACGIPESDKPAAPRRDFVVLVLLWLIVTAYNYAKAYHIDDTAYLEIAKWIAGHPFHPMSGILNWSGIDEPIYKTNQPHLFLYLMALWSMLFGFGEHAQHLLQAIAAMMCIVLFYRLARFFAGETAVWLTAVMILGPAFIISQNIMVDIPLLAAWHGFFNLLICGVRDENQTRRYFGASLACSAALLIKYTSLALLPILCLSLLMERRRKQYWTALVPLGALAGWSLFNYADYGAIHLLTRPIAGKSAMEPFRLFGAVILAVGGVIPIGLIDFVESDARLMRRRGIIYSTVILCLIGLVAATTAGWLSAGWSRLLLWAAFLINGTLNLACILPAARELVSRKIWKGKLTPDTAPVLYLVLWAGGTTLFYVLLSPLIAVRHVLLILPPLWLIAGYRHGKSLRGASMAFGLTMTVLLSAGLGISDWRFAEFERNEAPALMRWLPKTGTVWASGHWGWQWYTGLAGMPQVDVEKS